MTRTLAECITFALCVALIMTALAALLMAQRAATDEDRAHAYLAISADGREVTFRKQAPGALRICVEPESFAKRTCFTVGDVRDGLVIPR